MSTQSKPFTKEALSVKKPRPSLLDPEFILGMSRVLTDGAIKYEEDNWKKGYEQIYIDAALRHMLYYMLGETHDESSECHIYHAACNLMFIDYLRRHPNDTPN